MNDGQKPQTEYEIITTKRDEKPQTAEEIAKQAQEMEAEKERAFQAKMSAYEYELEQNERKAQNSGDEDEDYLGNDEL